MNETRGQALEETLSYSRMDTVVYTISITNDESKNVRPDSPIGSTDLLPDHRPPSPYTEIANCDGFTY